MTVAAIVSDRRRPAIEVLSYFFWMPFGSRTTWLSE